MGDLLQASPSSSRVLNSDPRVGLSAAHPPLLLFFIIIVIVHDTDDDNDNDKKDKDHL